MPSVKQSLSEKQSVEELSAKFDNKLTDILLKTTKVKSPLKIAGLHLV